MKFRRLGSVFLILMLLLGFAPSVMAAQFVDVKDSDWFARPVSWALREDITNGTTATTFSPYETCTKAQIITFLWRAAGEERPTIFCPFFDVSGTDYYYEAAVWAFENGLVEGNLFSGNTPCTRADVVTYLWKLDGSPYVHATGFVDVTPGASYETAVSWAVGEGITEGTGNGMFTPSGICTRGQIVTFLYRAFVEAPEAAKEPAETQPLYGDELTQSNVAQTLYALKAEYPELAHWDIDSSYTSEALGLTYAGCAGFALMCSDLVFGDLPITEVHSDFDRIKVGDMVRDEAGYHTVLVLEKRQDSIVVVEGNYNGTVHWERVMDRSSSEFYNFTVTTRYP